MKKVLYSFMAFIILLTMTACGGNSSEVTKENDSTINTDILSSLIFESYQNYIRITKDDVFIRNSPSNNAAQVEYNRYPGALMTCDLCPVLSEEQGWVQIPEGWVNKKDTKPAVNNPITPEMMNENWCGYVLGPGDGFMWRVYSPIGASKLAICDCNYELRLGKLIDNVFVFKYVVPASIEIDQNQTDLWKLTKYEGEMIIQIGTDYSKQITENGWEGETNTYWLPDLSKFTDQHLVQIFGDVIKNNETDYYYLNSELLTGTWVGSYP